MSTHQIAKELEKNNIKTFNGGDKWHQSTTMNVNIICHNTQLLSIYYYGRIAEQTTGKAGSLLCGFLIIIVLLDFIW